ncbi:hypothetical protein FQ154_19835 [Paeniglutamicibacter gangotriensis]|uniref:Uncharacterized protein n=1 Tax=Paeniglutamicibacter gangotriensis TaxID=254787 RepID=A0A5B0E369_9MICC|nr:hypothetical protein [Paeniglutamicibacter gangotriensis]KAA0973106.1 hypothetical protein FQ154_19835 [Paeniglutamicibacter gangotriensis]
MKDRANDADEHVKPRFSDDLGHFFRESEVVISTEQQLESRVADVLQEPFDTQAAQNLAAYLMSAEMERGRRAAAFIREEGKL